MKIITGATGQNHVTAGNDGEFNQGIFGSNGIVLALGSKLSASIVDNNTIKISDGDLIFQGRHALIEPDTNESVAISTGEVGYKRIDLIVARYELSASTGYETIELKVIEGTQTTGSPSVPSHATGDIRRGATVAEFPLYQVTITDVSITEVKKLFTALNCSLMESLDNVLSKNSVDAQPISKSTNVVSSGGLYDALANKADTEHSHTTEEITDLPDWAKASTKPTYKLTEVGVKFSATDNPTGSDWDMFCYYT